MSGSFNVFPQKNNDLRKKNTRFREIDNIITNIHISQEDFINTQSKIQSPSTKKNQLFSKKIPSFFFVKEIVGLITPNELDSNIIFDFTINTLVQKNTVKIINEQYLSELEKLYLKCKHTKYLHNLNEKKVITIFRQLLKCYDYCIKSQEKYINAQKYLLYTIQKKKSDITLKKINSIINFD